MLPKIVTHANALCHSVEELCDSWVDLGEIRIATKLDNDYSDGTPGRPVFAGYRPDWLPEGTSKEMLAAVMVLDYYVHEAGEHFKIGELDLNPHSPKGAENLSEALKLLALYDAKRENFLKNER